MKQRGFKEPGELPRRFYKAVEVAQANGAFEVRLDGRTPKSPAGKPLALPTRALADMVAAEWAGQGDHIVMARMIATRLAWTAIDRVGEAHAEVAAEVARYAGSDALCYVAEEPLELVERQARAWQPLLGWARAELGVELHAVEGVIHRPQPPRSLARIEALAGELDDFTLAALAYATALFGSAVLGLAVQRGRLPGEEAFALSRLDESFQEERWGVDAEAAERTERLTGEALMLDRWFAALR
ncbi:MAG TPA: ATP12 family protein [Caulobacteraceae bacterium]|nr:ATP12 family protein [Caulobacteraceae bacterium]